MDYLQSADLLPVYQSEFWPDRSTETAALQLLADMLLAVDCGDVAALVLPDLSPTRSGPVYWINCPDLNALCHSLLPHLYTDDTQVYGSFHTADVDVFSAQLTACTDPCVASWMQSNRNQLNRDKTTTRCQHQPPKSPLSVDGTLINPV